MEDWDKLPQLEEIPESAEGTCLTKEEHTLEKRIGVVRFVRGRNWNYSKGNP